MRIKHNNSDTKIGEKIMNIVVVGSINIDMVTQTTKIPVAGETVVGSNFTTTFGGKGANQAVCASRLGANVDMIACVGKDFNGNAAIKNLNDNMVNTQHIRQIDNIPSGIAQITLLNEENRIIIVKGANNEVSKKIVDESLSVIEKADLVLLQLEIPLETVEYVIDICHKKGIKTVLNPAPAMSLSQELIDKVTYIIPNENEYKIIFNKDIKNTLKKYPNKLILTKGSKGVDFFDGKEIVNIPAHIVKVVDTTGAGDAFNAAFSIGIVSGLNIFDSIKVGNKVASMTVQKLGAQTSMPLKEDVFNY